MIVLELRHGLTWQMIKLLVIMMPTRGVDSLNQRWDWDWDWSWSWRGSLDAARGW